MNPAIEGPQDEGFSLLQAFRSTIKVHWTQSPPIKVHWSIPLREKQWTLIQKTDFQRRSVGIKVQKQEKLLDLNPKLARASLPASQKALETRDLA